MLCYPYVFADPARAWFIDDIRSETCRLGGEVVVTHGFCNLPQHQGLELGVYIAGPVKER